MTDGIVDHHGFMRGLFNTWASLVKQRKLKYYPAKNKFEGTQSCTGRSIATITAPDFYISLNAFAPKWNGVAFILRGKF